MSPSLGRFSGTRLPSVLVVFTAITFAFVHTAIPWEGARAQPAQAIRGEWPAPGGAGSSALPAVPVVVLDALADENNTQVYVRVNQARYAAHYTEARSRCSMYSGDAWEACVDEARMKFGPPLPGPRLISPPL